MEFLPIEKSGEKVYAGFWKRLAAAIIDLIIFTPIMFLSYFLDSISIPISILTTIIFTCLYPAYVVYFHYKYGATFGKMFMKISVRLPNGIPIKLKHALLRSSVDIIFVLLAIIAQVIALANADSDQYLSSSFMERAEYIQILLPAWYGLVTIYSQIWYWGEFLVLLFNKRRRALHDFIAGTVVIHNKFCLNESEAAHNPFSP